MKFSADKSILAEAVISASKACAAKAVFSAQDGVLLSLRGNNLTVTGYDLETGIRVNIIVEGNIDGDIIVESRLFSDIIRKMPENSKITVEVKENEKVSVFYGRIKLNIQGIKGESFPKIIELNQNINIKMKEKLLKSMLSQIDHAIAKKEINPALMGARFEIENNMLYIISSDAVRLALRKEPLECADMGFTVPEKTVAELIRNLSDDEESIVEIIIDRNQICFSKKNYAIFSRLLDGNFVKYKQLIELQANGELIINTREFSDSLERSLLFINEKYKNPVICEIDSENNCIILSCETVLGEFNEELAIENLKISENITASLKENNKKNFNIAFNPRFMIDALRNSGNEDVKLMFMTEVSPIKVIPTDKEKNKDNENVLFIVVPVRLK